MLSIAPSLKGRSHHVVVALASPAVAFIVGGPPELPAAVRRSVFLDPTERAERDSAPGRQEVAVREKIMGFLDRFRRI